MTFLGQVVDHDWREIQFFNAQAVLFKLQRVIALKKVAYKLEIFGL